MAKKKVTRIGIGGPVGSGKTALVESITPRLLNLGIKVLIITNDVVTTPMQSMFNAHSRAFFLRSVSSALRQALVPTQPFAKIQA